MTCPGPSRINAKSLPPFYLEGHLTPEIAIITNHSAEAGDRYIKDYHRVEMLWQHGIFDHDQIGQLTRLSKRVAQQYIDLLPEKIKSLSLNRKNEKELNVVQD